MDKELYNKVQTLQNLLVDFSTGNKTDGDEQLYQSLRNELVSTASIKEFTPEFLITNRTITQFWQFIKNKVPTYPARRQFIWDSFQPLLGLLELRDNSPAATAITQKLQEFNQDYIHFEWEKALKRKGQDPEGAITSSRTLIETVCKHILDEMQVPYQDDIELPKLYKLTAQQLNLAPDQHNEAIFKQILGGCQTVVEGLGALRNKLSDSHGKKKVQIKPSARHAELAVNLAGAMSTFLLDSFQSFKERTSSQ